MNKLLLISTICFSLIGLAHAQSEAEIARRTGLNARQMRLCRELGLKFDPSDNSMSNEKAFGVSIPKNPVAHGAHYTYYTAFHHVLLVDQYGRARYYDTDLCRYNPATHRSQWQLPNGQWFEP